jgi:hypothetical protein
MLSTRMHAPSSSRPTLNPAGSHPGRGFGLSASPRCSPAPRISCRPRCSGASPCSTCRAPCSHAMSHGSFCSAPCSRPRRRKRARLKPPPCCAPSCAPAPSAISPTRTGRSTSLKSPTPARTPNAQSRTPPPRRRPRSPPPRSRRLAIHLEQGPIPKAKFARRVRGLRHRRAKSRCYTTRRPSPQGRGFRSLSSTPSPQPSDVTPCRQP